MIRKINYIAGDIRYHGGVFPGAILISTFFTLNLTRKFFFKEPGFYLKNKRFFRHAERRELPCSSNHGKSFGVNFGMEKINSLKVLRLIE